MKHAKLVRRACAAIMLACSTACDTSAVPYTAWSMAGSESVTEFGAGLPLAFPKEEGLTDSGSVSYLDQGQILMEDNILLLQFKPQTTRQEALDILSKVSGEVVGGVAGYGLYKVKVPTQSSFTGLQSLTEQLRQHPKIKFSGYNLLYFPANVRVPEDPEFKGLWELNDPLCQRDCDRPSGNNWWLEMVQAPLAWGIQTGKQDIPVGVVDVGFENHEDVDFNFGNERASNSHGLIVAGIIAAQNNDIGVVGINWRAPVRAYSGNGNGIDYETIVDSLRDMMEAHDVRVANLSLGLSWGDGSGNRCVGKPPEDLQTFLEGQRGALDDVIQDVIAHDALIVQAAGNCGANPDLEDTLYTGIFSPFADEPGYRQHVMIVAAANIAYQKTHYSQWGERISVVAPGGGDEAPGMYSTIPGDRYGDSANGLLSSGTSFAAPVVTGLASLLLSENPSLSAAQIKDMIIRGAEAGGRSISHNGIEKFVVNAYQALLLANEAPGGRNAVEVEIE